MTNTNITISVGIAFYNAQQFLHEAIMSVVNQSFQDWELILINDGSTDNSLQIANEITDPRIRIISDDHNKGLAQRLNEMVTLSQGKYFARMDADDVMHPDRLQVQYDYMVQHPEVDVLGSSVITIDTTSKEVGTIAYAEQPNSILNVINHNCFIHPTVMARKEWFLANKYDTDAVRMEDFNLWLRTIEQYKFYNLPQSLLYYRTNGLPYTRKYIQSMRGELRELKRYKSKIPNYHTRVIKIYAKCFIYLICGMLGCTNLLLTLRTKK